jgi:hypothetical protein
LIPDIPSKYTPNGNNRSQIDAEGYNFGLLREQHPKAAIECTPRYLNMMDKTYHSATIGH